MLLQALEVLQSSLQTLQSHPAGLLINGLALALLAVTALQAVAAVIGFVYAYFLRPGRNLKFYGPWAVVTGSTDGIGKAYCEELAKKGAARGGAGWQVVPPLCALRRDARPCPRTPRLPVGALLPQASTWCLSLAPSRS